MSTEDRNKNTKLVGQQTALAFAGPLPPPSILEGYERILPGSAERIIKMAEIQAAHRQDIERKVIASGISNSGRGITFALIIALAALFSAMVCIILGREISGSFLGLGGLGGLVATFITGTQMRSQERMQKAKEENSLRIE
jgi:uncharacterized membrane protein